MAATVGSSATIRPATGALGGISIDFSCEPWTAGKLEALIGDAMRAVVEDLQASVKRVSDTWEERHRLLEHRIDKLTAEVPATSSQAKKPGDRNEDRLQVRRITHGEKAQRAAPRQAQAEAQRRAAGEGDHAAGTCGAPAHPVDWKPGMVLQRRYELARLLGDGTFGRVMLAHDRKLGRDVAIKVHKDGQDLGTATFEAQVLKDIGDRGGASSCSLMYDLFTYDAQFLCIVLEPLGMSLNDFLRANLFRGFWMQDVQHFAGQSMKALSFLHDELRLVHTDLKPDNMVLCLGAPVPSCFPREAEWLRQHRLPKAEVPPYARPADTRIKLIDFGSSVYLREQERLGSLITTRMYRAPEVLLGIPWDERSDMWSLGCVLVELYSGSALFDADEDQAHLALMERLIGPLPQHMAEAASAPAKEYYLNKQHMPPSSARDVAGQRPLAEHVLEDHRHLADLAGRLLALDPKHRPSARHALAHPFFAEQFGD